MSMDVDFFFPDYFNRMAWPLSWNNAYCMLDRLVEYYCQLGTVSADSVGHVIALRPYVTVVS